VKDIEKRVLRIIGEDVDSPDVFTSANITQIRDSINDGIEELCTLTDALVLPYRIPFYPDTYLYRIAFTSAQFCHILRAYLPDKGTPLAHATVGSVAKHDPKWLSASNTPAVYMPVGVKFVGFYPMYAAEGHHVELDCVVLPNRYATDDKVIQLRDDFHDSVVAYAAGEYFLGIGDLDKANYWFGEYAKNTGRFGYRSRRRDKSPTLRTHIRPTPRPLHGYV